MQTITLPSSMPAEMVRQTVLDTAWHMIKSNQINAESFVELIALNAPANGGPVLFADAISRSFTEDAVRLSRALTEAGLQQYPADQTLLNYQKTLAPPRLISRTPAKHNFSKTTRWLSAHSHEYVDQWLALRDGELLGIGSTRKALAEQIGGLAEQNDVLITYVPAT